MKTCLLLPAYNESKTIGQIIQESSEFISEIVVINDGSSDETAEIAAACGLLDKRYELRERERLTKRVRLCPQARIRVGFYDG